MTNYEKLKKAHGPFIQSDWVENASVEIAEDWRDDSQKIALKILRKIRLEGISQAELASRMKVSSQQISKWVKGQENFKLDTINKLEKVLGIKLIQINQIIEKPDLPEISFRVSKEFGSCLFDPKTFNKDSLKSTQSRATHGKKYNKYSF